MQKVYKEGDKVFVPIYITGAGIIQHKDGTIECIKPDHGYWHTLTKEEADHKNHEHEIWGKWAKELEELIEEDKGV